MLLSSWRAAGAPLVVSRLVAVDGCLSGESSAVGTIAVGHSAPRGATERSIGGWFDDLTLLNRARARELDEFGALKHRNTIIKQRAARKNFLREAKIFAKTCCTISTISYNYQQVTSVFARFNERSIR